MIKIIGFDADDTLWVNEPYFQEVERDFCGLMSDYAESKTVSSKLLQIEIKNLSAYGFGVKAFMLSLVEAAISISDGTVKSETISRILELGKSQLDRPIELLDGVEPVLQRLGRDYRLIIATKGDLLDQERKLMKSGLKPYFHHIEVMSGKTESQYSEIVRHLGIEPHEFMMIGNSLKSDILPVLAIGGEAIYVPFHTIWEHEKIDESTLDTLHYHKIERLIDCIPIIENANNE